MSGLLIRGCEVEGRRVDVRVADGLIAEVAPGLRAVPGEQDMDAGGGALLPGLHDAHLHLLALAALDRSVVCGPPAVPDRAGLAAALTGAPADEAGWVRGVGYVETVAGNLDAATLDALHADRPVRVQHRSGALWCVNTAALDQLGAGAAAHPGIERQPDGTPTGRLWRADDWLRDRLPAAGPEGMAGALRSVGRRLAAVGITSVCDASPDLDGAAIGLLAGGALAQRLQLLGAPLHGPPLPPGVTAGPYKIVLADSGLPALADLVDRIRTAHGAGRAVALHCVTREALVLLLVAVEVAGVRAGDRVEHAGLVPFELLGELARLRLRVVTQPGFLADRGDDYLRDVPAVDLPDLYRCRSLLNAGVPVALSSDAPFGPLDPWQVMFAAVHRGARSGAVLGAGETITAQQALDGHLAAPADPGGPPRRVAPGAPGDLVLLDRPLRDQLADLDPAAVSVTIIGGVAVEHT